MSELALVFVMFSTEAFLLCIGRRSDVAGEKFHMFGLSTSTSLPGSLVGQLSWPDQDRCTSDTASAIYLNCVR